jgi:acyl carrier protein
MARGWAVTGPDPLGLAAGLTAGNGGAVAYPDLGALSAAIEAGEPAPEMVLACAGHPGSGAPGGDDVAAAAQRAAWQAAELAREWAGLASLAGSRLMMVTRGAVEVTPGEGVTDLTGAAAWGAVRAAQAVHPGRIVLADLPSAEVTTTGGTEAGRAGAGGAADTVTALDVLTTVLGGGEPELAVRGGSAYLRRLARPAGPADGTSPAGQPGTGQPDAGQPDTAAPAPPGTVLVTGGTGTLGGLVARHLAVTRRATHLLLASRSGPAAPGVPALAAGLAAAGAQTRVTACDVADRPALSAVLAGIPAAVPLTGVIHAAGVPGGTGVPDDTGAGPATPAPIDAVMRPKADAAWHLHQLTAGTALEMFVLFSGAAGALGAARQWDCAAGDAFLDALASYRRAAGQPAVSLAWGPWAGSGAMAAHGHVKAGGRDMTSALTAAEGLALLDAALRQDETLLVPARLDVAGLRARSSRGEAIPALLHGLAGAPASQVDSAAVDALRSQLAAMPEADRSRMLLNLVRAHVAAVLGHGSPEAIEPDRAFSELGFDSVTAVELRNRLNAATGLRLPATLIFDYPVPSVLAGFLRAEILPESGGTDSGERELRTFLASVPLSHLRDAGLIEALMQLAGIREDTSAAGTEEKIGSIDTLDAESLVRMALDSEEADY